MQKDSISKTSRVLAIAVLTVLLSAGSVASHPEKREAGAARYRDGYGKHMLVSATDGDGTDAVDPNSPLFEGQGLLVDRKGVAEVILEDGTVLILGPAARAVWNQLPRPGVLEDLSFLRLWSGPLLVEREDGRTFGRLTVDMPAGQVVMAGAGLFYVDAQPARALVGVLDGTVDVLGAGGALRLGPGRSTWVETGFKPLAPERFTSDQVDRRIWEWRAESHKYETRLNDDPRQDPRWNIQFTLLWGWGSTWWELCRYGNWTYIPAWGWCWIPRGGGHWSPYSAGYWICDDGYWFWVGNEPWGWAPYRYGHWAWDSRWGWFWVPGYRWCGGSVYWWRHGNRWYWCAAHPSGKPAQNEPAGIIVVDEDPVGGEGPPPTVPLPIPIRDPGPRLRLKPAPSPWPPGTAPDPRPPVTPPGNSDLPAPTPGVPQVPPLPAPVPAVPTPPVDRPAPVRPAPDRPSEPTPGVQPAPVPVVPAQPVPPRPAPDPAPRPAPAPTPSPAPAPAPRPAPAPPPAIEPIPLPPSPPAPVMPPPKPAPKEDKAAAKEKRDQTPPRPEKDRSKDG